MEAEAGVMHFEGSMNQRHRHLQEAGKGKEVNLPLEFPEGTQFCQHLNVSLLDSF